MKAISMKTHLNIRLLDDGSPTPRDVELTNVIDLDGAPAHVIAVARVVLEKLRMAVDEATECHRLLEGQVVKPRRRARGKREA